MLQFKAKSVLTCSQWVSCLHYLEVGVRQMICTQGLNILLKNFQFKWLKFSERMKRQAEEETGDVFANAETICQVWTNN